MNRLKSFLHSALSRLFADELQLRAIVLTVAACLAALYVGYAATLWQPPPNSTSKTLTEPVYRLPKCDRCGQPYRCPSCFPGPEDFSPLAADHAPRLPGKQP